MIKQLFPLVFIFISTNVLSQITFTDASHLLEHESESNYFACGVVDVDYDGKDDLIRLLMDPFIVQIDIEMRQADGSFKTEFLDTISGRTAAVCAADVDRDNDLDLFLGHFDGGYIMRNTGTGSYINDTFPERYFSQASNFVDINQDGWIDLFVCDDDSSSLMYVNDGTGNLIEDTNINMGPYSGNYGSVWSDYDNDGDQDMYLSKCSRFAHTYTDPRRVNRLYRNDGNNQFTDVAPALGLDDGAQSWAADFGDIDNDGDMDLVIADHKDPNLLFENTGSGAFIDITNTAGLDTFEYWQVKFYDFDNDGFLDVIFGGAHEKFNGAMIFRNNGDKTFSMVQKTVVDSTLSGKSFAVGELNGDGFLDYYSIESGKDKLYLNDGNQNNYLMVNLRGKVSNLNAIGAKIEIYGPWGVQVREVRGGESYGIMNTFKQHFGLGIETDIDSMIVRWPSGIVQKGYNIQGNQTLNIVEGWEIGQSEIESMSRGEIEIFPNPINDVATVKLSGFNSEILTYRIVDSQGRTVTEERINDNRSFKIEKKDLKSGAYWVQVIDNQYEVARQKFIIE